MKVEKITDAFVNEFDAQTQGCSNDCAEYRGKTKSLIEGQLAISLRDHWGYDRDDQQKVLLAGKTYCYRDYTPKTSIYL